MKFKSLATILMAAACATSAISHAEQAAKPPAAKVTTLGSATVFQLKDGQFVFETHEGQLYYYLLDHSAVALGTDDKGLLTKPTEKNLQSMTMHRIAADDKLTARMSVWQIKEDGKGKGTGVPITHEAARRLMNTINSETSWRDLLVDRVGTITKQLSRQGKLPSALLDANFLEEKVGDGLLGPADHFAFYSLKVKPEDIPAWRAALMATPVVNNSGAYAAPRNDTPWWVGREDFGKLEFFSPKLLTDRFNGWVGLAPDGRIFIYAFTM